MHTTDSTGIEWRTSVDVRCGSVVVSCLGARCSGSSLLWELPVLVTRPLHAIYDSRKPLIHTRSADFFVCGNSHIFTFEINFTPTLRTGQVVVWMFGSGGKKNTVIRKCNNARCSKLVTTVTFGAILRVEQQHVWSNMTCRETGRV